MDIRPILYYAAEGSVTELEKEARKLEKQAIKNGSTDVDHFWEILDDKGRNVLFHAAITDNLKNFQFIMKTRRVKKEALLRLTDYNKATVLHWATQYNCKQVVKEIVQTFDKLNPEDLKILHGLILAKDSESVTPLHIAATKQDTKILKIFVEILKTPKVMELFSIVKDKRDRSPLHYAACKVNLEALRILLFVGARNSTRDHIGATPAHYAAQFSVECLKILFAESKITEVNDNEGRSCLMWAVCAGNIEVINYLIQREDAPKRAACDKNGYTALHLAAMVGHEKVCKILTNQGWSLSERDNHSNTALHLASGRGHTDVLRCLVASGANMNDVDEVGRTAVFWACMGGQAHTLHCMIKELGFEWRTSGSVNTRPKCDKNGRTALHAAAVESSACINVLLSIEKEDNFLSSPLVGWLDKNGETALHEACLASRIDCILSLLNGGSAVNAFGRPQRTPLDCAMQPTVGAPNLSVIEYLRSKSALTFAELRNTATSVLQRHFKLCKRYKEFILRKK